MGVGLAKMVVALRPFEWPAKLYHYAKNPASSSREL